MADFVYLSPDKLSGKTRYLFRCRECGHRKPRHAMRHDNVYHCKLCHLGSFPPLFQWCD